MHTPRPTRSQVIGAIVTDALLHTRMKWREFTERVADHYQATTALADRIVTFHVPATAADYERCADLNTQTVRRMVSGEKQMPADLEESLLVALPPDYRERAYAALLDRAGLMLARKPATGPGNAVIGPCALMRHTADVLEPLGQALADNVLDTGDAPLCVEALESVGQLMGACVQLEAQLRQVVDAAKVVPLQGRAKG